MEWVGFYEVLPVKIRKSLSNGMNGEKVSISKTKASFNVKMSKFKSRKCVQCEVSLFKFYFVIGPLGMLRVAYDNTQPEFSTDAIFQIWRRPNSETMEASSFQHSLDNGMISEHMSLEGLELARQGIQSLDNSDRV